MTDTHTPALIADHDRWLTGSWRTDKRYYQAHISRDLFGMWVLQRRWGGLGSKRGNSKTYAFAEYEDAAKSFEEVGRKRQQRGYIRTI